MFILRRSGNASQAVDLGLIGVNTPNRSRNARFVTHNLNDLGFVNRYTGKSPVEWQMTGEFITQARGRPDNVSTSETEVTTGTTTVTVPATSGRTNRLPMRSFEQLDEWARAGVLVTVEMYSGFALGSAYIRQLSETGSILVNQTMTTQWQMTLLFEEGGGIPASDLTDAANTGVGIGGPIQTGPGGPGTGGPLQPGAPPGGGPGTGGPTAPTGPTTPPTPTPGTAGPLIPPHDGSDLLLQVVAVPPSHLTSLAQYNANAVAIVETISMNMMVTSRLLNTILVANLSSAPGPPGTGVGHWTWVEVWDNSPNTHPTMTGGSAHQWEPLDENNPWTWHPNTTDAPHVQELYDLSYGMPNTWSWYRVRIATGTDDTPNDDTQDPDPGGRNGQTYRNANVSRPVGIFWGEYTNQEILVPPGEPAPNQPLPTRAPAKARLHMYAEYGPSHMPATGDSLEGQTVVGTRRHRNPDAWRIPYSAFPRMVFQLVLQRPADQLNIPEYSVTVQKWDRIDNAWEDEDGHGTWLTVDGRRINPTGLPAQLTGITTVTRTWVEYVRDVPDSAMDAGPNEISWYRGVYNQGGDIFYTAPVGVVYPNYRGNFTPRPARYDLDPEE